MSFGSDFLLLDADRAPSSGLTAWLVTAVREAVGSGRLATGTRMPATRTLGTDLGISRGVVVEAYRRLSDEGVITGTTGRGTTVIGAPTTSAPAHAPKPVASPLSLLPPARSDADLDLSPGVPDLAAFPRAVWLRAERAVLGNVSAAELGYGDPRGNPRLRVALSGWLARTRGVRAAADDIIVVAGVAQSLALLSQTLRSRGVDRIAVEDPGSRGARDELRHWGMTTVPVTVDASGLRVDRLTETGVATAVLTPAHQYPTGVVLSPGRRRELLDWAARGGLIIEDDYDAEHRYDRSPVPALHASDPAHVAHTGSTSKTLAPGMRMGWLIPPPELQADLVAARHASDLGSPAVPQLVLAHLIETGDLERHLRSVRIRQRRRRDAVVAAIREHLPSAVIEGVAAGLHLTLTLPQLNVDDVELAARIRAEEVVVQPMSWHRFAPGPPGLLLGYAANSPDRLDEAVRRIARVVAAASHPSYPAA